MSEKPNDDELADLADAAYKAGEPRLEVTNSGLRAVYEAGTAAVTDEHIARAMSYATPLGYGSAMALIGNLRMLAGAESTIKQAVAAERERCARVVEGERDSAYAHPDVIEGIAAAIRAGDREEAARG